MRLGWLAVPGEARRVAEALCQRQPATLAELAARTGLDADALGDALAALRQEGVLRGGAPLRDGRPGYLWLDLLPAARALHGMEVAA